MVKLLHDWLSRLTLLCLVAFAAGGVAKAYDVTFHCKVTGEGTAKLYDLGSDWAGRTADVIDGQDAVLTDCYDYGGTYYYAELNSFTGTLLKIIVNGEEKADAMQSYANSGGNRATFMIYPDEFGVFEADLELVFEGGDEPEVPEYEFLINLTVEGGEADVEAQYTGAEGRQTVDLVKRPN